MGEVALRHLAAGEDGIEGKDRHHGRAGGERAAELGVDLVDGAVEGRAHHVALEVGDGGVVLGARGGERRQHAVELELGQAAALGELAGGGGLGLALGQHLAGGVDGRLLALVAELGDQVAAPDLAALLDRQLLDDAGGAGGEHGALVGVGAAGKADGAGMLNARRVDDADGAQRSLLLRRGFGRPARRGLVGGAADGGELARRDPGGSGNQHGDGRNLVKLDLRHLQRSNAQVRPARGLFLRRPLGGGGTLFNPQSCPEGRKAVFLPQYCSARQSEMLKRSSIPTMRPQPIVFR